MAPMEDLFLLFLRLVERRRATCRARVSCGSFLFSRPCPGLIHFRAQQFCFEARFFTCVPLPRFLER